MLKRNNQYIQGVFKIDGFIGGIIVSTILLVIGGVILASRIDKGSQVITNPEVNANVDERLHDWGEIGLNDGNVEKTFQIKNEGSGVLALSNVTTSCACTTAQLSLESESSPIFGMHTKSNYVLEVPEGKAANLKVVFDPAFHGPSGVGPINRQVKVLTNDADNPELDFSVTAMVRN